MPDRVESFGEFGCSKNYPRTWPGFVRPIQNRLQKGAEFDRERPSRAETGLAGRKYEVRLRKEELTRLDDAFKKF